MKLPSRQWLSTLLLQRVRDDVRTKVVNLINAHNYVSLVTDGWADTNSSSIINFMVVAPGMPSMFWSSWSTRSKQHTARYFAEEIGRVTREIEHETTAQVVSVVTDNASNMRSATDQVQSRRPNVISGGCVAHVLNLLMQDVSRFAAVKAVVTRAVAVTRFVRDHLALFDEFKRLQCGLRDAGTRARSLVLPVPTRWYSIHACMRNNVLNSQETLEALFLNPSYDGFLDRYRGTPSNRKKLRFVIELVRDDGFWSSLRTIVRMFGPVIEALRALEADNGFISGVYTWFRWLRYHIAYGVTSAIEEEPEAELAESDEVGSEQIGHGQASVGIGMLSHADEAMLTTSVEEGLNQAGAADLPDDGEYQRITAVPLGQLQTFFREKILKRWKYVHTNAMAVAFLLESATNLDNFVGEDDENVDDQVCRLATRCGLISSANVATLTAEILKFKCMKRRGGEELRMKYLEASPRDYWGAKDEKNYPLLKKVAEIVFAVPTSSAASERAWSIFDHIHSKRRNRLSVEKVETLAYIYINYGTIQREEIDLARHQSCPERVD